MTRDARDTPELSPVKFTTAKTRHMVLNVYSKYKKKRLAANYIYTVQHGQPNDLYLACMNYDSTI